MTFDSVALERGGRRLFEGMSFALGAGEALQVAGPNGAGKSSLIRLAAGLLAPAAGRVERPARMALADDRPALDRDLPLGRALAFWSDAARAAAALDAVGLGTLHAVPVRLLSSGQARRAALARVIAADAPLWLLDEPLNALDAASEALVEAAIARHRAAGGAVLAASHQALAGDWRRLELGA